MGVTQSYSFHVTLHMYNFQVHTGMDVPLILNIFNPFFFVSNS